MAGAMKRQWRMRRELLATADGQRRWDRAYQELLLWTHPGVAVPALMAGEQVRKEQGDACGDLRAGIDAAAGAGADD